MKKSLIALLCIFIFSSINLNAASAWTGVLGEGFQEVSSIDKILDTYSNQGEVESLEVSSKFIPDPDKAGNYILDNEGSNAVGEYFIYKNVKFNTIVGDQYFDIKIKINNVVEYSSGGVNTKLVVAPNMWVESTGYVNVDFDVNIINKRTAKMPSGPIAFYMTDIDAAQIMSVHGLDKSKYIISGESILDYRENGGNIEFTSIPGTTLYEKTGVVAETSGDFTFNFSLNSGLDVHNPYNDAGAFKIDVRIPDQYGKIDLLKVDQDNNPLEGAEFTIYDNAGAQVQKLKTDVNGYAQSSRLPLDKYVVKETMAPEGYELNRTEFNAELLNTGEIVHLNSGNGIVNNKVEPITPEKPEVVKPITPEKPEVEKPEVEKPDNKKLVVTGSNISYLSILVMSGLILTKKVVF